MFYIFKIFKLINKYINFFPRYILKNVKSIYMYNKIVFESKSRIPEK